MPAKPSKRRVWLFRLGLLANAFLILFLTAEVATRLVVPEGRWRFRDASENWRFDDEIGWVQGGNLDISRVYDGRMIRFRTNDDGLTPHTATRVRPEGSTRIMIVGDSGVVGRAVQPDETVNAQLQRQLEVEGLVVDVVNAGVEGYSTDQALLLMERLLPLYRPDVVIYSLHPNDFGGIVSGTAYGNAKPHLAPAAGGELELISPAFEERKLKSRTRSGLRNLIQRSAVYRLAQPLLFSIRSKFGAWEEELLLGIDSDVLHYDEQALERLDWPLAAALIERMQASADSHGARFLFYLHPELTAVWEPFIEQARARKGIEDRPYDRYALEHRLAAIADEQGIAFCPLVAAFLADPGRGPFHLLPRDYHCNPVGYELTAERIITFLLQNGFLERSGDAPDDSTVPAAAATLRPRFAGPS